MNLKLMKRGEEWRKQEWAKGSRSTITSRRSLVVFVVLAFLMSAMVVPTECYQVQRGMMRMSSIRGGADEEILLSNADNQTNVVDETDADADTVLQNQSNVTSQEEMHQDCEEDTLTKASDEEAASNPQQDKEPITTSSSSSSSISSTQSTISEDQSDEEDADEGDSGEEQLTRMEEGEKSHSEEEDEFSRREQMMTKSFELRQLAKEFHDQGNFEKAAASFREAATIIAEEDEESAATCILHEALCFLKQHKYAQCITSCSHVLQDGIQVVQAEQDPHHSDADSDSHHDQHPAQTTTAVITTNHSSTSTHANSNVSVAVRARAHHRRAKARLALGDTSGALDDARSAAFLGDRNAVTLYGKLMRQTDSNRNSDSPINFMDNPFANNPFTSTNPFFPSSSSSSNSSNNALLQSLLGKATDSDNDNSSSQNNPFSGGLFGELASAALFNNKANNNNDSKTDASSNGAAGGIDTLAKSMVSSFTKRIEQEETQKMLCNFLNGLNEQQILTYSSMAGVSLNQKTCSRIANFAQSVTPKGIQKTIITTKRIIKFGKIIRAISNFISKYKHLIILLVLLTWVKSALLRPIVIKQPKKRRNKPIKDTLQHAALNLF